MKTLTFTYDGHDYTIPNANDDQTEPRHGDHILDCNGELICWFLHEDEYFVVEDNDSYIRIHENEPNAAWSIVKAHLSSY